MSADFLLYDASGHLTVVVGFTGEHAADGVVDLPDLLRRIGFTDAIRRAEVRAVSAA